MQHKFQLQTHIYGFEYTLVSICYFFLSLVKAFGNFLINIFFSIKFYKTPNIYMFLFLQLLNRFSEIKFFIDWGIIKLWLL